MLYTSQKVFKLDVKRPQLWSRYYAIDDIWNEFIIYPNNKVYYFDEFSSKWIKFSYDRYYLEKYGEFVTYL